MLHIKPVKEEEASEDIRASYAAIRAGFNTHGVPVIFQYLAGFPGFFHSIWEQSEKNVRDMGFITLTRGISLFANQALSDIYRSSPATSLFVGEMRKRGEDYQMRQFIDKNIPLHASLYLLSLCFREGLKGKYVGIKQLAEQLSKRDREALEDVTEGFMEDRLEAAAARVSTTALTSAGEKPVKNEQGIATSPYREFFRRIQWDMDALLKREDYLTRRVELERFALSKLSLFPHPIDASFAHIARKHADSPHFAELLYLLAEFFPTQEPYKLMLTTVMKLALTV